MAQLNDHVARRVRDRVRQMPGLDSCEDELVWQVWRNEDISDLFMTIAITTELADYGFAIQEKGVASGG